MSSHRSVNAAVVRVGAGLRKSIGEACSIGYVAAVERASVTGDGMGKRILVGPGDCLADFYLEILGGKGHVFDRDGVDGSLTPIIGRRGAGLSADEKENSSNNYDYNQDCDEDRLFIHTYCLLLI